MAHVIARWPTLLAVLACAAAVAVTGGRPAAAATSYGVVATIPLGECSSPSGVSVDPATDAIYVASLCITTGISTGGEVTQVNGATNQVTGNLPLGEGRNSQGTLPRVSDVAVDPATNTIFEAVSNGVPQLTVVNGATDAVTATIPTNVGHLAVDSATGTVFVTTGSAVSVISEASDQVTATIPLSSAGAVAVDSATGTVFVTTGSAVSVISEASHQVTATIPLSSAGAVAVDSATGTVFVTTGSAVSVISEASDQVTATIPLSSAGAVAVDPSAGVVYVAVGTTSAATAVIDASTNQVTATVPASSGYTPTDAGVGVDPSTHTAYASAGLGILPPDGILSVIGSTSGGGTGQAPAVTTNAASAVTSSGATVGGSVNPEGQSTTYRFDYGTSTSYGSSLPSPAGSAGSGTSAVTESASLTGLRPGTVYHYRIEATNATATTDGSDQAFTTAGQAPAVTTNAASAVTSSGATVGGSVNPEGQSTTYRFHYGTSTSYGSSVPSPAGSAGSGTSAVTESASLTGLRSGTVYHYRIEATNAAGTTFGADKTFTTARHR